MIACRHLNHVSLELSNWFVMCVQITFIHYYISVLKYMTVQHSLPQCAILRKMSTTSTHQLMPIPSKTTPS